MTWTIPVDVAVTYDDAQERFWALRVGEGEPRGLSAHGYVIWCAADGAASTREVADRIAEYAALGLAHFILSGYPHVEEAYHFGEGVRPRLVRRGLLSADDRVSEPIRGAFLPSLSPAGAS